MEVPTDTKNGTQNGEHFEYFFLTPEEVDLVNTRNAQHRLFFAVLLNCYRQTFRFDISPLTVLPSSLLNLAEILDVPAKINQPSERSLKALRQLFRKHFKTAPPTAKHSEQLQLWLSSEILPFEVLNDLEIRMYVDTRLQEQRIEPLTDKALDRVIQSAKFQYETSLFSDIADNLNSEAQAYLNGLLLPKADLGGISYFGWLGKTSQSPGLNSMLELLEQLEFMKPILQSTYDIEQVPRKRLTLYQERIVRCHPSDIKSMPEPARLAKLAFYVFIKSQEISDLVVEMFIRLSRNVVHKSEQKVVKKLINKIKVVSGKENLLCSIAEICIAHPDSSIRDVVFPIISEEKLNRIVKDIKRKGTQYQSVLHQQVKRSYTHYYRKMILPFLSSLTFKGTSPSHQPLLDGLQVIKTWFNSGVQYFPKNTEVPLDFIAPKWRSRIINTDNNRIQRVAYEIYVLKQLGELLNCREIWVTSAFRHRDPDEDIPQEYKVDDQMLPYDRLSLTNDSHQFVSILKSKLSDALSSFNAQVSKNNYVEILPKKGGHIKLTPLAPKAESKNLNAIKSELQEKWASVNLLDALKEVELDLMLTQKFVSHGERVYLKPKELSERILLAIYGMGTNAGLKRMCASNPLVSYSKLQHIKQYFLSESNLRNAIGQVADALFKVRSPDIWGEKPLAVASDSTQFSAYFQNLIAEYHNRYGGRGVMIYWHVEKKAVCIHSKLKSVSSSEVASMIHGVLHHCTEMSVNKNYVDTHGQSEVGFAFSHLLGFELMPRFANIHKQKLSQCELGDYQQYPNLQPILTETINWDLIESEYTQMVRYAASMLDGYTAPESLLKRFNRNNRIHPTYRALSQLGKVLKTIFLCNYLMQESLRREVQEGLNVVELWNGVSKFIFYGRSGEISSNDPHNQTLSVLCLHLLQLSMVYINTLMLQEIIMQNGWMKKLTAEDKRALTPLIYAHINPYGLFPLNFEERIGFNTIQEVA